MFRFHVEKLSILAQVLNSYLEAHMHCEVI